MKLKRHPSWLEPSAICPVRQDYWTYPEAASRGGSLLTDWRKAPLHARDLRMTPRRPRPDPQPPSLPPVPLRGASGAADTLENHAFWSGAALAHLHLVLAQPDLPQPLLRDRLALRAAEASVAFQGRRESARELRDALHLLRPGDLPGPAGDSYQSWRRAVTRPVSVAALHRALPDVAPDQLAVWLDAGQGGPVSRAALVLETVLAEAFAPQPSIEALDEVLLGLPDAMWCHSNCDPAAKSRLRW